MVAFRASRGNDPLPRASCVKRDPSGSRRNAVSRRLIPALEAGRTRRSGQAAAASAVPAFADVQRTKSAGCNGLAMR